MFINQISSLKSLDISPDPDDPNAEGAFEGFGQLQYIKFPTIENFITKFTLKGFEEFFINRKNSISQKPLSLTIITGDIYL
ncbi:hypothetical protein RIR_jg18228.t1 [Rhizophagus irregularis DAOM 181602=DAOM 197198]|nr:hypothetical protein RIR_jg18228.t1 [Rhizophagus irregularis DAOM 181602=DAOM 197198]